MLSGNESDGSVLESVEGTPVSSPLQQVPGSSSGLASLDDVSFHHSVKKPYLRILVQPIERFRFRYKSESGSHGQIMGRIEAADLSKTYPTVELRNYYGCAVIKCQLYEHDRNRLHPHSLKEDESVPSGNKPGGEGEYAVCFPGLGVLFRRKVDIPKLLYKRMEATMPEGEFKKLKKKPLQEELKKAADSINLNIVRLRFSAHDINTDKEICEPVFSEPIYNAKNPATNMLKILETSVLTGGASGGTRVILLTETIQKESVVVNIFERDSQGNRIPFKTIELTDANVHKQCAILFYMPAYRDVGITQNVDVYLELHREDGSRSNERTFTYTPEASTLVRSAMRAKRKLTSSVSSAAASPASSTFSEVSSRRIRNSPQNDASVITLPNNAQMHENYQQEQVYYVPIVGTPSSTQTGTQNDQNVQTLPDIIDTSLFNFKNLPEEQDEIREFTVVPTEHSPNHWTLNRVMNSGQNPVLSQANVPTPPETYAATTENYFAPAHASAPFPPAHACAFTSGTAPAPSSAVIDDVPDQLEWQQFQELVEGNHFADIYNLDQMESDSGRPSRSKEAPKQVKVKTEKDIIYFKAEDEKEIKKIIRDICELKKNGSKDWVPKVREKLMRLFDIRQSNGDTFLHMTLTSHLASFEFIASVVSLAGVSYLLDEPNAGQFTVLHLAAIHDMPRTVTYLIDKGCNPLCVDLKGNTAIHYAAMSETCLQPLLEAIDKRGDKCDFDVLNREMQSPLHVAVLWDRGQSVRLLAARSARPALHLAVEQRRLLALRALLDTVGQDAIDECNWKGLSALQVACAGDGGDDTVEIVKLLLEKGADPLRRSRGNKPAWWYARRRPPLWPLLSSYVPDTELHSCTDSDSNSDSSNDDDDFESAEEGDSDTESSDEELTTKLASVKLDSSEVPDK